MLIFLVASVKLAIKAGAFDSDKTPTPRTPFTGSPIVKGFPNVAPELKFRETSRVAGSAIIGTHQAIYQWNLVNLIDLSSTIHFLFELLGRRPKQHFQHY